MRKLTLTLTQADFEALHLALDRARKGTTSVKVARAALSALLADHSKLIRLHDGRLDYDES